MWIGHSHETYKHTAIVVPNGLKNGVNGTIWHHPPALGKALSHTIVSVTVTSEVQQEGTEVDETLSHSSASAKRVTVELLDSNLKWIDETVRDEDPDIVEWLDTTYASPIRSKYGRLLGHCTVSWLNRDKKKLDYGPTFVGKFLASFLATTAGTDIGIVNRGGIVLSTVE
jgi:hypothetical protein